MVLRSVSISSQPSRGLVRAQPKSYCSIVKWSLNCIRWIFCLNIAPPPPQRIYRIKIDKTPKPKRFPQPQTPTASPTSPNTPIRQLFPPNSPLIDPIAIVKLFAEIEEQVTPKKTPIKNSLKTLLQTPEPPPKSPFASRLQEPLSPATPTAGFEYDIYINFGEELILKLLKSLEIPTGERRSKKEYVAILSNALNSSKLEHIQQIMQGKNRLFNLQRMAWNDQLAQKGRIRMLQDDQEPTAETIRDIIAKKLSSQTPDQRTAAQDIRDSLNQKFKRAHPFHAADASPYKSPGERRGNK